ncbi:MAG TPA: DUF1003 domain-containing protein [Kofleriaceae bacterium]|jgi:uncharacterized membrane protein
MPTDAAFLKQTRLFATLDDDEREVLAKVIDHKSVKAGTDIFSINEPGDAMYVVKSGKVELHVKDNAGEKIVLNTCEQCDQFGEVSLLDGGPRTAGATALEDTELCVIDRDDLLLLFKTRPEAGLDMLAAVGGMTRKANQLLRSRVTKNANEIVHDRGNLVMRVADWVADFSGSITFLVVHIGLFTAWIGLNLTLPKPFDEYPFGLLTMCVSLEAIILSTLLLFSSNRGAARDRVRNDIEYDINLKAELEIAHLHQKTDKIHEDMLDRMNRIERALTGNQKTTGPVPTALS